MHLKYVTTKPKTNSSPPILSGSQKMLTEESENKKKTRHEISGTGMGKMREEELHSLVKTVSVCDVSSVYTHD